MCLSDGKADYDSARITVQLDWTRHKSGMDESTLPAPGVAGCFVHLNYNSIWWDSKNQPNVMEAGSFVK